MSGERLGVGQRPPMDMGGSKCPPLWPIGAATAAAAAKIAELPTEPTGLPDATREATVAGLKVAIRVNMKIIFIFWQRNKACLAVSFEHKLKYFRVCLDTRGYFLLRCVHGKLSLMG